MKLSLRFLPSSLCALALGFFPCFNSPAHAASPATAETAAPKPAAATDDNPDAVAARFFGHLQEGNVDAAYEELLKGTKIAESPKDVSMLKSKTREALALIGPVSGYDLIESKDVGKNLRSATYVSLGKNFPLRWRFYFYKSADRWKLIDLRITDRLAEMFNEPGAGMGGAADSVR